MDTVFKAFQYYAEFGYEVVITASELRATHLPTGKVVHHTKRGQDRWDDTWLMCNSMNATYHSLNRSQ